jgi:hypothetical protein
VIYVTLGAEFKPNYTVMSALSQLKISENRLQILLKGFTTVKELPPTLAQSDLLITLKRRLHYPEMFNRQSNIALADPATLSWLEDDNRPLNRWVLSDTGVFWIQGKPGSGKSTMKRFADHLSTSANLFVRRHRVVPFYFNGLGSQLEKSMEGLLRSILYQMISWDPAFFVHCRDKFSLMPTEPARLTLTDLKVLLVLLLGGKDLGARFCILIDALDECAGLLRDDLVFLQDISTKHKDVVQICIASQPSPMLVSLLSRCPGLELQQTTSTDIQAYVESKLRATREQDAGLFEELCEIIVGRARGVFLWVVLVVENAARMFEEGDTVQEIKAKVVATPVGLNEYYTCLVKKIQKDHLLEANLIFNLLCRVMRPLSLRELRYALAFGRTNSIKSQCEIEQSESLPRKDTEMARRLRSRCIGFVEVSNNVVQFMHQSVKDFLFDGVIMEDAISEQGTDMITRGHQFLLRACTRYLCLSEIQWVTDSTVSQQPFLAYSSEFWLDHYRKAVEDGSLRFPEVLPFFRPDSRSFGNWRRLYHAIKQRNSSDYHGDDTICSFAAQHGLIGLLEMLIKEGENINIEGGELGSPLQAAVVADNLDIARFLLDNGANVNSLGGRFGTPIAAAITLQNQDMISLLLRYGADVTLYPPGSPFHFYRDRSQAAWDGYRDRFSQDRFNAIHAREATD